jgi:hypothetical protein
VEYSGTELSSFLSEAYAAFTTDIAYSVAMCKSASSIIRKREVWAIRLELRRAERSARDLCCTSTPFTCKSVSPCGVGDCLFAPDSLKSCVVPQELGSKFRPQMLSCGKYSLESAIPVLRDLRV